MPRAWTLHIVSTGITEADMVPTSIDAKAGCFCGSEVTITARQGRWFGNPLVDEGGL